MSDAASSRRRRWLGRLGWAAFMIAVLLVIRFWQQRDLVEGAAPALAGTLLDGRAFDLASERSAPTLIYFWGTWCPVCRVEQGAIDSLAREHHVVTVALQSGTPAEVQRYLSRYGLRWQVVNDPGGQRAAAWGVHVTPTIFVVDRRGEIRFREVGYTTGIGLRLRLWLAGR